MLLCHCVPLLSSRGQIWAGGRDRKALGRESLEPASEVIGPKLMSFGFNGVLDPVNVSADVSVDSWLLFGSTGDITP
jgi:hypothetical protein